MNWLQFGHLITTRPKRHRPKATAHAPLGDALETQRRLSGEIFRSRETSACRCRWSLSTGRAAGEFHAHTHHPSHQSEDRLADNPPALLEPGAVLPACRTARGRRIDPAGPV